MSQSDTRRFLEDILVRFDPSLDISTGSRAESELIQPILTRIGLDPFDDDIATFIRERVRQSFPDLAITEADELTDTVIDPMRVIIEPIVREIKLVKLRSSLRNVESLSDDEVDALLGNFYLARQAGGYALGVVRIWFATPQTISLTLTNPATTRGGLRFYPTRPQQITSDQMILNIDGSEYYFDVNYTAESRGDEYNVEASEIVSIGNLPTATRVRNLRRFREGAARETSVDYAARTQSSIGDKTLTVGRGISATLTESFPTLKRMFVIGFRDPEMTRDVVRGGSLGPIPSNDAYGEFYGVGAPVDDIDADSTSSILGATGGQFVARLGAVGEDPESWYTTLTYIDPDTSDVVAVDARVTEIISATQVRTDHEMPLDLAADSVTWMLREKKLTISDVPGGIAFPDSIDGSVDIRNDEVHIGGKTDVYVAGEVDAASAEITRLTDESPIAKGINAQTSADDTVTLHDIDDIGVVEAGMSLVLEEGEDAASYRIIEVIPGPSDSVRITVDTVGTQGGLTWKIVDDIDVKLTEPKSIKIEGDDLLTSAGSDTVTTSSASNFLDVGVAVDDILRIVADPGGGDFTITEVNAVELVVDPVLPRTLGGAAYTVFTRSGAVSTPVLRVKSVEILDSSGAPSGTKIPYRDPVAAISSGFQNEGSGIVYDGTAFVGFVSTTGMTGAALAIGSGELQFTIHDPDTRYGGALDTVTLTFTPGDKTPAQAAAEINANAILDLYSVKAVILTYNGLQYLGITSPNRVALTGGTGATRVALGFTVGGGSQIAISNDEIRAAVGSFPAVHVRLGDLVEFVGGNNAGVTSRVVAEDYSAVTDDDPVALGHGPVGPAGAAGYIATTVLKPDVGARVRVGRPSLGSARVYYLDPTSAEFDYDETRFTATVDGVNVEYRPDPENTRTLLPAPPLVELPTAAETTTGPSLLTDTEQNFLILGIRQGDIVDVLYRPITGTSALGTPGNIAVNGLALVLRIDADPFITVSFPFDMPRQDVVDYINEAVGVDIAALTGTGELQFTSDHRVEIDTNTSTSTVLGGGDVLFLAGAESTTDHPDKGEHIIYAVGENYLQLSSSTPITVNGTTDSSYRLKRYVQRISSTEMNDAVDASGLYYFDVQLVSLAPGDTYNIGSNVAFEVTGNRGDGYRLSTDNESESFSRAEVLRAQISPSILLVGSSDSPEEYVQVSQQNIQISYERSQLVDDIQSFCDSDFQRVVCEEILVRHLSPHYVAMNWNYVGGDSEPDMKRALQEFFDTVEPDSQLEVGDIVDELRRRQAVSVYVTDSASSTGRTAPLFVAVYHTTDRDVRAVVVKDFVDTNRMQRYIMDNVVLRRVSTGGIR